MADIEKLRSDYRPVSDADLVDVLIEYLQIYADPKNWHISKGTPPHYLRDGLHLDFWPSNVVHGHNFAEEALEAVERYRQGHDPDDGIANRLLTIQQDREWHAGCASGVFLGCLLMAAVITLMRWLL